MIIIAALLFITLGAWLSRMCGGAPPKLPLGLDQWLYALPYGGIVCLSGLGAGWAVPAYAAAFAGKRTGHGNFLGLKEPIVLNNGEETLEFLIKPLRGRVSAYWYKTLGMALTGLAVTLMPGAILMAGGFVLPGAIIAASGLLKAPAYMTGWAINPDNSSSGIPHISQATEIGELLTGFFAYGALALAYFLI